MLVPGRKKRIKLYRGVVVVGCSDVRRLRVPSHSRGLRSGGVCEGMVRTIDAIDHPTSPVTGRRYCRRKFFPATFPADGFRGFFGFSTVLMGLKMKATEFRDCKST